MSESLELERFPCFYTFKVFGRRSATFAGKVCEIISRTLGPVPQDSVKLRESARGRYVSVTVCVRVESRKQLERIYTELHAEEEVLLYI